MKRFSDRSSVNYFRQIIFLAVFIVGFMFTVQDMRANAQVCYPDCETSTWIPDPSQPGMTYVVTLPCGEPVLVFYRIRVACDEYYDLFIESVEFINGYGAGFACGQTMTASEIINNIVEQMVIQNPMQFPPTNPSRDTCVERYRVTMSPCWYTTFPIKGDNTNKTTMLSQSSLSSQSSLNTQSSTATKSSLTTQTATLQDPSNEAYILPCQNLRCCLQAYRVCFINGQKVITFKPAESLPGECSPNYGFTCHPVCN